MAIMRVARGRRLLVVDGRAWLVPILVSGLTMARRRSRLRRPSRLEWAINPPSFTILNPNPRAAETLIPMLLEQEVVGIVRVASTVRRAATSLPMHPLRCAPTLPLRPDTFHLLVVLAMILQVVCTSLRQVRLEVIMGGIVVLHGMGLLVMRLVPEVVT